MWISLPIAATNGWRTLSGVGWTWKKNRDFLYHAMNNVRAGKARIFDVGFDAASRAKFGKSALGKDRITNKEIKVSWNCKLS